jgi:hypothetical protein
VLLSNLRLVSPRKRKKGEDEDETIRTKWLFLEKFRLLSVSCPGGRRIVGSVTTPPRIDQPRTFWPLALGS